MDTITGFNVFVPRTIIESAKVNQNFSVFRGTKIPVHVSTATAQDNLYDLGTTEYRWRRTHLNEGVDFQPLATATSFTPSSSGYYLYNRNGNLMLRDSAGLEQKISSPSLIDRYDLAFGTFQAATTTSEGVIVNLNPGEVILGYAVKLRTSFAGGSITGMTFSLGLTGDPDKYIPDFNVFQANTTTAEYHSQDFDIPSYDVTTSVYWTAVVTGSILSSLTAGDLDLWIYKTRLTQN